MTVILTGGIFVRFPKDAEISPNGMGEHIVRFGPDKDIKGRIPSHHLMAALTDSEDIHFGPGVERVDPIKA